MNPLDEISESMSVYQTYTQQFGEKYQIRNKPIAVWREYFRIDIPPDFSTMTCCEINKQLLQFNQEASFYHGESDALLSVLKTIKNKQFREEYSKEVQKYTGRKLPSKDTLTTVVEEKLGDIIDNISHAETEVNFWKEMLTNLGTTRKIIENATFNIGIEAKSMAAQGIYEGQLKKYGK